jgi:hypothetical protein
MQQQHTRVRRPREQPVAGAGPVATRQLTRSAALRRNNTTVNPAATPSAPFARIAPRPIRRDTTCRASAICTTAAAARGEALRACRQPAAAA